MLLGYCTARGSGNVFSRVGLTKVEAHKSSLFTEKFPCIENKEHMDDFVITLYSYFFSFTFMLLLQYSVYLLFAIKCMNMSL